MRTITAQQIEDAVAALFLRANYVISSDIEERVKACRRQETGFTAQNILDQITENYHIAREDSVALCQDCGMALVFAEVGQDVHIEGGFEQAVQQGVRRAYDEGYLRKSVVAEPLFDRKNTGDNTPAIVYTRLVPGSRLKLMAVAKGFGSENCSKVRMFLPANTLEEIRDYIAGVVRDAGPNTCPPVIVGVGIGGTMEKAALMAKHATTRTLTEHNPDPRYAELEQQLLEQINASGIGPGGFGGRTTAIAVNIEHYATHIASIPVAVNLCCHASRHATAIL